MKLGIFDSGLGGLVIAKSIREKMLDIDILYFGDTLHLPYGNKSSETIYAYSKRAIEFLFEQDCNLIITACNTVSASALRRLQQEYLPSSPYAHRRILGVVVPTLECAIDKGYKRLGVIATNYTVKSNIFEDELKKIDPEIKIFQENTPLLVPLIENKGMPWIDPILAHYLNAFDDKNIECLILGCTHYPYLKDKIASLIGADVDIISQDEIIPDKLSDYLHRHPEIADKITNKGQIEFLISDMTDGYKHAAKAIYKSDIALECTRFCATSNTYIREAS